MAEARLAVTVDTAPGEQLARRITAALEAALATVRAEGVTDDEAYLSLATGAVLHEVLRVRTDPTPQERVDLFTQQAAELRDLRQQLAEAKRRECTALCSDVEMDRDLLQRKLNEARSQLHILGIEYGEVHREFTKANAWGQRQWNAWRSARRRALKHADQRDAWRHLAETTTTAPAPAAGTLREQLAAAIEYALMPVVARADLRAQGARQSADAVLGFPAIHDRETAIEQVRDLRDDLRGITGARWIADSLDIILAPLDPQEQRATPHDVVSREGS